MTAIPNIKPGALRARRYRRHQKEGIIIAPVPIPPEVSDALYNVGLIKDGEEDDRQKVGEAVARVLENWAELGLVSRQGKRSKLDTR